MTEPWAQIFSLAKGLKKGACSLVQHLCVHFRFAYLAVHMIWKFMIQCHTTLTYFWLLVNCISTEPKDTHVDNLI